jgi:hypothetical protein
VGEHRLASLHRGFGTQFKKTKQMPKKYILKKGVTIEYHFTKYTEVNITDAISKKLLLEVPSMVKFFEVTPTKKK